MCGASQRARRGCVHCSTRQRSRRDCAIWRGLKGDDICRPEEPEIYLAQSDPAFPPLFDEEMMPAGEQPAADQLARMNLAAGGGAQVEVEVASLAPARDISKAAPPPPPVASKITAGRTKGGMFYVIASFRQVRLARRMVDRKPKLGARVLAGTAKGRAVYRVAVGPIAKPQRQRIRRRLTRAGFADAWKLPLKKPRIVLELAARR